MNPPADLHPSPDRLSLFGTGQLSADEAAGIEAHVSDCTECCEALRGVADDSFIALVRRATSIHPVSPSGDTTPQFASRRLGEISADSTSPDASPAAPGIVEVPEELREHPRYRVLELLGHGGMGAVYKAEHRLMQRTVALKLIARDLTKRPGVAERFVRETQTAGRLAHANIAQAFDAEQAGDTLFLVMEFVPGTDLARFVRERGPLPCAEACHYIRQAALALQHAHERGMVHRDIKPHNLMRTPEGEIKVLDFGLARFDLGQPLADTSHLTEEGLFMGTADYVAPE
jgi:serine/threonine protein kinase